MISQVKKASVVLIAILWALSDSVNALDLQAQVDPLATQLLANKTAVGLVVGIYSDGETQVIGYGETEKGTGAAPDGDTIYEIGSASKAFTGILLADLILRGKVKLDDPMQKYLPDKTKSQLTNASGITFEHLVTHTSGLPGLPDNFQPADPANPYADYTFANMFEFVKNHKPRRAPGEYEYSNFGMGLLGALLAGREKMSYEELLIERIAKPCGMGDTCINLSTEQRQRLAHPYDAALQVAKNWDLPGLAGAGGIRSTTNDMLKFIAANLAQDHNPLTKAMQLSHEKRHSMSDGQAIGLAWHIHPDGITRWHNGMTGGYASWVSVIPGHDVGVVVLSNTAATQITELGSNITRIAFEKKNGASAAPPVVEVAPEVLKKYEGVFVFTPEFAITVTLEGNQLMAQGTGQPKLQLDHEADAHFSCKAVDAHLFFVANKGGDFKYLVLHQNGANQTATRQDSAARLTKSAAEFPKRAPYAGVRWEGDKPVVNMDKNWFTLVSIDGISAADIVAFCRGHYQDNWQKRFEEDLVEVLAGMGHEPKDTVELVVVPDRSSKQRTVKNVPMTEANRRAIKAAAREDEPSADASSVAKVPPEVLKKYEGVYAITPQFALTITCEGDQLSVQATGQQKLELIAESETKFACKLVDAQLTFAGEKDGKAEMVILHQNGANQVAMRQN